MFAAALTHPLFRRIESEEAARLLCRDYIVDMAMCVNAKHVAVPTASRNNSATAVPLAVRGSGDSHGSDDENDNPSASLLNPKQQSSSLGSSFLNMKKAELAFLSPPGRSRCVLSFAGYVACLCCNGGGRSRSTRMGSSEKSLPLPPSSARDSKADPESKIDGEPFTVALCWTVCTRNRCCCHSYSFIARSLCFCSLLSTCRSRNVSSTESSRGACPFVICGLAPSARAVLPTPTHTVVHAASHRARRDRVGPRERLALDPPPCATH